jgi:microcystin-dependent protein
MIDPYVGQIVLFAGTFAPNGWFFCDGSLVPISEYDVLFALIGTTYGGDGINNFALPDLRGRVPIHQGTGTGLSTRVIGEKDGTENVTVTAPQVPAHTHALTVSSANATASAVSSGVTLAAAAEELYSGDSPNNSLNPSSVSPVGGSQPHSNIQPYLALNFIIAWAGIFPSQS